MRSIKTKILVYVIVLLLLISAGFMVISYYTASNAITAKVEEMLPPLAVQASQVVKKAIEGQLNALEATAVNYVFRDADSSLEDKLAILREEAARSGHLRMSVVDSDGNMQPTSGSSVNIKDREYFTKAISGESNVSDPIISKVDNSIVLMYAVPIKQGNTVIGVLTATRDGGALSEITNGVAFGKSGSAFMINKNGDAVANKDINMVIEKDNIFENAESNPKLKPLAEIQRQMVEGKTGIGQYEYDNVIKYLGYAPVEGTEWSIGVASHRSEILAELNILKTYIIIFGAVILLIGAVAGYFIAGLIATPIKLIADHLKKIAGGDFTQEVPKKCRRLKDEVGVLAESLKTMQESVGGLIKSVVGEAENVNKAVLLTGDYMSKLSTQIEDVSATTEELSAGMEETAASAEEMNATAAEIDAAVDSIAIKAQEGSVSAGEISKRANDLSESFMSSQQIALKVLSEVKDKLEDALDESKAVEKINELADAILQITSQTNLLALNAAIEAARAGEAGRGFAVVADEIRKLAENSKDTANQIQDITKTVTQSVENLAVSSNSLLTFVNTDVVRDYNAMLVATEDYSSDAETINNLVVDLSATSEELAASIQNMIKAIEEITDATNEGANGTSSIAQKTIAVAEMGSEVMKQADASKRSADILSEMIVNFKI